MHAMGRRSCTRRCYRPSNRVPVRASATLGAGSADLDDQPVPRVADGVAVRLTTARLLRQDDPRPPSNASLPDTDTGPCAPAPAGTRDTHPSTAARSSGPQPPSAPPPADPATHHAALVDPHSSSTNRPDHRPSTVRMPRRRPGRHGARPAPVARRPAAEHRSGRPRIAVDARSQPLRGVLTGSHRPTAGGSRQGIITVRRRLPAGEANSGVRTARHLTGGCSQSVGEG